MSIHGPHSAVSSADEEPAPGWRVISLIDPAASGSDLAFTDGLTAFELPELLLWGRPTEGNDPGADWLLTHRERARLLNRWALETVIGQLGSGERREERFDGGHTVARFRFGRPVSAADLRHPHLPPQTPVISVAWSLQRLRSARAPAGREAAPLSPAVERRMRLWISRAEATTQAWRLRLDTVEEGVPTLLPHHLAALSIGSPSHGRFGPMTPWVDARIAQVMAAGSDAVAGFLARLHLAEHARCEDCLLEQFDRIATRSHRNAACREASQAAQELALAVAGWPESSTPVWAQAVSAALLPLPAEEVPAADETLRVALTDGLETLIRTAVLADLLAPSLIANGSGPWEWAVNGQRIPGRPWLAAPKVRRAARQLLAQATPSQLAATVEESRRSPDPARLRAVSQLVTGLQTVAAASPPSSLFRRDQRRGLPRPIVRYADELAEHLVAAMALPHRFAPDSWDLIRQSLHLLAPALPVQLPKDTP
jgi:hypothetical protein